MTSRLTPGRASQERVSDDASRSAVRAESDTAATGSLLTASGKNPRGDPTGVFSSLSGKPWGKGWAVAARSAGTVTFLGAVSQAGETPSTPAYDSNVITRRSSLDCRRNRQWTGGICLAGEGDVPRDVPPIGGNFSRALRATST